MNHLLMKLQLKLNQVGTCEPYAHALLPYPSTLLVCLASLKKNSVFVKKLRKVRSKNIVFIKKVKKSVVKTPFLQNKLQFYKERFKGQVKTNSVDSFVNLVIVSYLLFNLSVHFHFFFTTLFFFLVNGVLVCNNICHT